ncbi:hypothetical protein [Amycolatopsis sp. H20-H5]|uniref:hypothetical protein n=1 Tax=Amycolatopsis sp. H20-H5 TaxID=3046309 RepID=UPI002DB67770|nr:hypothetical protein [Amycolatopsis sp. H20-H5]MEC3975829.1 hypothetical protein [Amycolatopsis sp. H20-H5]
MHRCRPVRPRGLVDSAADVVQEQAGVEVSDAWWWQPSPAPPAKLLDQRLEFTARGRQFVAGLPGGRR